MARHYWTDIEREVLRQLYPEYSADECARAIGKTLKQVQNQVKFLGLSKSPEWIARRASERSRQPGHGGRRHQFKPGLEPWNKGMKGLQIGGVHSRFKPGTRPHSWKPVGHEVVRDGQLWRKVTDENRGSNARFNFKPVSVIVWESVNGPVPPGQLVVFKPGHATTIAEHITIDRLELITRAENMRRNTIHNYPPAVKAVIRLIGRAERALEKLSE